MPNLEDLKQIYLLQNLTDAMREKILPLISVESFDEKENIFDQGSEAHEFFMLKTGKVLLKVEVSEAVTISLGAIKPGYSFGWSALMPGSSFSSYATAAESCEVFKVPGAPLLKILDEDPQMGYLVFQGVARILKNRLERRTGQFLRVLSKHIDLDAILT